MPLRPPRRLRGRLRLFAVAAFTAACVAPAAPLRVGLTGQALIEHDLRIHAREKFDRLIPHLRGRDVVFTNLEVVIQTGVGKPIKDSYLHAAPAAHPPPDRAE